MATKEEMNTRALNNAITTLFGQEGAMLVRTLYQLLCAAEEAGYEEGRSVGDMAEYTEGYDDGYNDARVAFYGSQQPEYVPTVICEPPYEDGSADEDAVPF